MSIIERARASGKYPPSLLQDSSKGDEEFEKAVMKVLDANATGPAVPEDFKTVLQMASILDSVATEDIERKKAALISRRCLVLALVGSTPSSVSSLDLILQNGYLSSVKAWMDDILGGSLGGVDLLLHLLSNIAQLPVTKSVVKDSGMGKAIGSVEKNKICAGTPNEVPIKERIATIKEAWNKSVKARKSSSKDSTDSKASLKRNPEDAAPISAPIAKKPKVDESKKSSSLSSLMKKMAPTNVVPVKHSTDKSKTGGSSDSTKERAGQKKQKNRVKWKDHFGGNLTASKILEEADSAEPEEHADVSSVSWSDRRKRDRLREKELLAKAKRAKLTDDDDDIGIPSDSDVPAKIQGTISWHAPSLVPLRSDAPRPKVNSKEKVAQTTRMASVIPVSYESGYSVPDNPIPLSDVEQALDMTSQSSIITQAIPFFVPQAPVLPPSAQAPQLGADMGSSSLYLTSLSVPSTGAASAEIVQSLGLPMFLVGQDVQALQTLASTPSLLNTFVDSNGMYDQVRLTSLVQTLSQGASSSQQQPPANYPPAGLDRSSYGVYNPSTGSVGAGIYGGAAPSGVASSGFHGAQSSDDGNLHLSGYGPSTTQTEIIALFSPYVIVDEVVMKTTFCFVNTSDPLGAMRAREALNGALLGGQPVRINTAQRKSRDAPPGGGADPFGKAVPSTTGASYYGSQNATSFGTAGGGVNGFGQQQHPPPAIPGQPPSQQPMDVRDDRGNPATKNLFVAGYGQGTSETLLRQVFSPHCEIVGIILKGTFSFINTADKSQAIRAREVLSGTMLNGGVLRINFAKESGRLGTSFDLTYGKTAPPPPPPRSHYGPRGF